MPLSSTLTYDQPNPHRPTIDELGGGAFQNDPVHAPGPDHPSAEMFNQATKQIVALAGLAPSLKIQVEFVAGAPAITQLVALGSTIKVQDFTLTDNGNGDTTLTIAHWAGEWLRPCELTVAEDAAVDRERVFAVANGWRVKTKLGTVGADAAFVLALHAPVQH